MKWLRRLLGLPIDPIRAGELLGDAFGAAVSFVYVPRKDPQLCDDVARVIGYTFVRRIPATASIRELYYKCLDHTAADRTPAKAMAFAAGGTVFVDPEMVAPSWEELLPTISQRCGCAAIGVMAEPVSETVFMRRVLPDGTSSLLHMQGDLCVEDSASLKATISDAESPLDGMRRALATWGVALDEILDAKVDAEIIEMMATPGSGN